jgi:hypothetical protein
MLIRIGVANDIRDAQKVAKSVRRSKAIRWISFRR